MQKVPVSLWTLLVGMIISPISIWIGQHHHLLPIQASAQAPLVDNFFNVMFTIAVALFLIVEGTIVIFLFVYRRRAGDASDGIPIEGNLALEIFWTAIPTVIVIALGIYSVNIYNQMGGLEPGSHPHHIAHVSGTAIAATMDNESKSSSNSLHTPAANIGIGASPETQNKPADLVVNVQGMQFAWLFNYPETDINAGELHIPVGADVQLNLSATDVIHSFWVPQFRLKQDAIPGVPTELRFVATKPGTYPIVCTELCGGYHGSMRSQVIVHSQEEFNHWLTENQVAQQNSPQILAVNPGDVSPTEFLAPYVQNMGINSQIIPSFKSITK
ncbi:cytochrome C oxidase subunit II [Cylindrospermopsis raciborskii S07]|jgi:cytochrome c oxidase subunit 2|uniref:Cytochrome c oxidase subunit 2 n=2 Tax=Cylindrospermopsis raciborskii TaxID=77022 RepID=A0A853MDJ5_9CYAN|nr:MULTISPECIES: cytochrome c oxidase subunit II [Cylindrospermopsis]MBU6343734.1 cytochrome c oxidase subunit II [Cyanobacteria bacterium REEB494]EFA68409.1 cytochrome C oxidase subunit II, transmembrane region protein [Cylindrospermopsis raciborskii CS-505]KRH96166.1 cytochrome C oxidase subunit II [Cylindrospermopsis sp. CR12]MCH4903515.1 cytochrome c oxidase subunit II [Cylindrospermopsis raciborskii CHAB3438]MEB3146641.1 cytochrome c oxidase subunit II [Cylindrospermopsis raciborskii]